MKRATWSSLLTVLAVLVLVNPAGAFSGWCRKDPIVLLNGTKVNIFVSIPKESEKDVKGPILTLIKVPRGVEAEVIYEDDGFNGHGEKTVISGKLDAEVGERFPIEVSVRVPIDDPVRMKVVVKPDYAKRNRVFYGDTDGLLIQTNIVGDELSSGERDDDE